MNKTPAYFELQSIIVNSTLNIPNADLINAMRSTEIHSFGWPIGAVIDTEAFRPKAKDKAIEAVIKTDESLDNWSLTSQGGFYLLKTLFEDRRDSSAIFIDVRLVRLLEAFARIGCLYKKLGARSDSKIKIQFKVGGLTGRILKVANPNRMPFVIRKICDVDSFSRDFEKSLSDLLNADTIEGLAMQFGIELAQLFDSYVLPPETAKQMIREHSVFRGVNQALSQL